MKKATLFFMSGLLLLGCVFLLLNYLSVDSDNLNKTNNKLSKAELAYYSAAYEFERTRDPVTNSLPSNVKSQELAFVSNLPIKENYYRNISTDKVSSQYLEQEWIHYGPDNIAGRILCIAIDVENTEIIMAGSASGGLWRSMDGGSSWVKVTPPNYIQSIRIAFYN